MESSSLGIVRSADCKSSIEETTSSISDSLLYQLSAVPSFAPLSFVSLFISNKTFNFLIPVKSNTLLIAFSTFDLPDEEGVSDSLGVEIRVDGWVVDWWRVMACRGVRSAAIMLGDGCDVATTKKLK